jgi:predicted nucleic acid-binding protein
LILVDTSVWIDHLRHDDSALACLLNAGEVVIHPFVIGELALGNLKQRDVILDTLSNMPRAKTASDEEALAFINQSKLYGLGIGYIDAHLLASVRLMPGTQLWTRDKRLSVAADQLGLLAAWDGH